MEHDKPFHSGALLIPVSGKIILKKSWQPKYCMLFKSSKFGIERLEVYDNIDSIKQTPSKIITLQDCIKITPKDDLYFAIVTKSGVEEFGAIDHSVMRQWLTALQSVVFPEDTAEITSINEDNDLYCPSGEGIFNVKLHESPASLRCGLESKFYLLVLTDKSAQLKSCQDNNLLFTWPYCFIRRYGYKDGKFSFEAGRKCETGEGIFYLEHSDQQEIFRTFALKIKSMKKFLSTENFPAILDMDNSFHAALTMEARSRSPLPASITSSTHSLHNISQTLSSKVHMKQELEDPCGLSLKPIVKIKPEKPPRKFILPRNPDPKPLYESVGKYDEIQYISDAWKTMGVGEVDHVEKETSDYMTWGLEKKPDNPITDSKLAPKIITEPQNQEGYDKLNFFRTNSRTGKPPPTYKQVKVKNPDSIPHIPFNDYDEVQVNTVDEFNKPKPNEKMKQKQVIIKTKHPEVNHQFHNNEPYAVISKPKRV